MVQRHNIWANIDWISIILWLVIMGFGWMNIYSANILEADTGIFDMSQRYGKQFIWIGAALILAVLVTGGRMTRNEIAEQLNQIRLYAHDLRLLRELEQAGLILGQRRTRHHVMLERDDQYRFMVENWDSVWGGDKRQLRWGKFDSLWEYQATTRAVDYLRNFPR